jgi:ectoine hydroxylase-related dioxygenase (phytanoyl-CoA dioxygenase family)
MSNLDIPKLAYRIRSGDADVTALASWCAVSTSASTYAHAAEIQREVVVYRADTFAAAAADPGREAALLAELYDVLACGPGVFVVRDAVDTDAVHRVSEAFRAMITEQRQAGAVAGDHFAAVGANDRVWNALEKLAVRDPDAFVDYYCSDTLALASRAWLGPGYQMTSQVNQVNPGGAAQRPHRDYHLGFLSDEQAAAYPAHVHLLSPALTLQGAVAHCEMTVDSGPTKLLPHSQKYPHGYVAWRQPAIIDYFEAHYVQMPLDVGDAMFFNPALLHAAGTNRTEHVRRLANLLQVSSAFGRAMESVDRTAITCAVYPALARRAAAETWPEHRLHQALACAAEGYAFPTNLDRDAPVDGLAPATPFDTVAAALRAGETVESVGEQLHLHAQRRLTS